MSPKPEIKQSPSSPPKTLEAEVSGTAATASSSSASAEPTEVVIDDSIVKISAFGKSYDHSKAHDAPKISSWVGSGFVIADKLVVTNAHVADGTRLTVKFAKGDPREYLATVLCIDHSCDLALLSVSDPRFLSKAAPIPLAKKQPDIDDPIEVLGFPIGGKSINKTTGHVSRIENKHIYAHSGVQLPTAQVTAAINPGNSGGPALSGGEVIGVAFQVHRQVQGGGQIIPVQVLGKFLEYFSSNRYLRYPTAFPEFSVVTNTISEVDKTRLGLGEKESGVLVTKIATLSSARGHLEKGDIITAIDGVKINSDGSVNLGGGVFEHFDVLIKRKEIGESIRIGIRRKEEILVKEFILNQPNSFCDLVQVKPESTAPSYLWAHGLQFRNLTYNYLAKEFGSRELRSWTPMHKRFADEEVVFIDMYLPNDKVLGRRVISNDHSREYTRLRIKEIDGVEIRNLTHAAKVIACCTAKTLRVTFHKNEALLLEVPALTGIENQMLLQRNGLRHNCSLDILRAYVAPPVLATSLAELHDSRAETSADLDSSMVSSRLTSKQITERAPKRRRADDGTYKADVDIKSKSVDFSSSSSISSSDSAEEIQDISAGTRVGSKRARAW